MGTIKYKRQSRKNHTTGEVKYYGIAVVDRTMEFDEFIQHMAEHNSPYSRGVIQGVLTDMLDCLKELVLDGKSVRIGDLGLFSAGFSSKGAPTAKEWNSGLVQRVNLNVRNTKTWSGKNLLKLCSFQEMTDYQSPAKETEEGEEQA